MVFDWQRFMDIACIFWLFCDNLPKSRTSVHTVSEMEMDGEQYFLLSTFTHVRVGVELWALVGHCVKVVSDFSLVGFLALSHRHLTAFNIDHVR